jgi:periplasmic divalent cation tolerance protein
MRRGKMGKKTDVRVVLVTCGKLAEARKIARTVVGKRLAPCVNVGTAPVESIYGWNGKVETAREYLLVIKSRLGKLAELEREVKRLHSYETPEFLVLGVEGGAKGYLDWVTEWVSA